MAAAKRIVVTGGSGVAGRHVIKYLLDRGHDILNVDLAPLPSDLSAVHTIRTDLTDSGQVFNALSSNFHLTQPFREPLLCAPDAVIHFAGHARNMLVPDNETFRGNALGTYHVIEAACKLGVKKIVLASSISVYGVTFAQGDIDFPSFPVDEEVDANPMDTYGISKICAERTARGFARRYGVDIYVLRLGNVVTPLEHKQIFDEYIMYPLRWKGHCWSYIDARDLGKICDLCVQKDGLGFQIFNTVNDSITNYFRTEDFLRAQCPTVPITRQLGEREAPISNEKMRRLLGFVEDHDWRKYYQAQ